MQNLAAVLACGIAIQASAIQHQGSGRKWTNAPATSPDATPSKYKHRTLITARTLKTSIFKTNGTSCSTPVWWLHVPKCGTSFATSVMLCPTDSKRERGMHIPLPRGSPSIRNVVSVFRDPAQRLASSYADLRATPFHADWGANKSALTKVDQLQKLGLTPSTDEYLGKTFLGCQTNMVVGKGCMSGTPEDPEQAAEEAITRVDKFRFVGILEQWGLSICLYNYKAFGKRFVARKQLENSRPTPGKQGAAAYDTVGYPVDLADERLYEHVLQRFIKETKQYGISKEACSFDWDRQPLDQVTAEEFFGA